MQVLRVRYGRLGVSLALMALAACGGGGGDSGQGTPAIYEVTISVTGAGAVTAPTGISCRSTCTSSISQGTVLALSASADAGQRFVEWGGACSGTLSSCTVTVGARLSVTARFEPLPPTAGWRDPFRVQGGGAAEPVVAIDGSSRSVVAWRRLEGVVGPNQLLSMRGSTAGAFGAPERLDTGGGDVTRVRLAVDRSSGRGAIAWTQTTGSVDLYARVLDPSTGWGPAILIENQPGVVGRISIGVDTSGNAVAVWSQIGPSTRFSIYASRYASVGGWTAPALLESNEVVGTSDADPVVAVTPAGDAIAVWKRSTGTSGALWSSRYTAATGWSAASLVVTDAGTAQTIGAHDLMADARGDAVLVWGQADVIGGVIENGIWFKRFTSGVWQTSGTRVARPISLSQGVISTPFLRMNAAGAALVAWVEFDTSLSVASAPAGAGFGSVSVVRPAGMRTWADPPAIGIDSSSGGWAIWSDPDTQSIGAAQRVAGSAWSQSAPLESFSEPSLAPALAVNESGNAVLAWSQLFPGSGTEIVVRQYVSGR